ncbi:Transposable element P transposase [Amphibalanus amphitrite]|uniref:Transposable element P transposase n=1 Tax=Amphibalanus amphitrite TaxID=1232801 RepID=A0A6A4XFV0_AMPAM|nr:Transposable element P transposase [Amphibalanus amphitrite]
MDADLAEAEENEEEDILTSPSVPGKLTAKRTINKLRCKLREAGFVVTASVCDMGTPNQDLYRKLGVTADCPTFLVDDVPVTALHDIPHLIKCVRNGLLKHGVAVDGQELSWRHITAFYEEDKDRPIRTAPKLTKAHLQPDAFKKMKVKLATQIFSRSTAAGMLLYSSLGILPADVIPTAIALDRLNNTFDVLNSCTPQSPNPMKRALSVENEEQLLGLLRETRAWISRWRVGNDVKVDFVHGLKLTITAVIQIWTAWRGDPLTFMMTRRLNQDGLENLFGVVRMCHGPLLHAPGSLLHAPAIHLVVG